MEEARHGGQVADSEAGHRFWRIGLNEHRGPETQRNSRLRNRRNREVLEPGGLNVERVRALLRGSECPRPATHIALLGQAESSMCLRTSDTKSRWDKAFRLFVSVP